MHAMHARRQTAGRTAVGLLGVVMAAACSVGGPDLQIAIDNTDGPKEVTVTVDSSGPGMTGGDDVHVLAGNGAEWSVPLASTWEVKVNGRHVIGSDDRTDLALPSAGDRQDLTISIRVAVDGTVMLLDAHWVAVAGQPGPSG